MSVAISQSQPWAPAALLMEGSSLSTSGLNHPAGQVEVQADAVQVASVEPDKGTNKKSAVKERTARSEAGRRAVKRRIVARQAARRSSACLSADELNTQLEAARERERAMCEHAEALEARSRALSIELDVMQRRADRELAVQHEMEEQVRRLRASVMMQMQGQEHLAVPRMLPLDPSEASSSAGSAPGLQSTANLDLADNASSNSETEA